MTIADQSKPEALLGLAAAGDRNAIDELYDRFAPRVLGIICRILSDRRESELVLEEIFLRLWEEAAELSRARASVAAWLVLGGRAAAEERLRERGRAGAFGFRHPDPSEAWSQRLAWLPDPEAIARLDQRRPLLLKVLGQLPKPQLRALERVAFSNRAQAESGREVTEPTARLRAELLAAAHFLRHRRRVVIGSWPVSL